LFPNIDSTPEATGKIGHGQHHGGDQVQLSGVASWPTTDTAKLATLQAAVSSGSYQVSPSQVANSIINDAMQSY
jgi:anti-sigma28 factor (negative regulator of flagellin synthesis)